MSLYSFEGNEFVVFAYFVYNGVKVGTLLSIRLQLNENYVTTRFNRPICRAWMLPLSTV